MKILKSNTKAFTALELMVVILTVAVMIGLLMPALAPARQRSGVPCASQLSYIALGFHVWSQDHGGKFPMEVSTNSGGTKEFTPGLEMFRHFQALSNVLTNPKLIKCPSDKRLATTNFATGFDNTHVSYFIGLDANESLTNAFLAGDRNLQNGEQPRNGILQFTPAQPIGWGKEMHKEQGNVLFVDGHVARLDSRQARSGLADTGLATNRFVFP
jgi:prepilin-type processing-associated H-X9-DG protein